VDKMWSGKSSTIDPQAEGYFVQPDFQLQSVEY
jgi:hypothetical protein